jgi:uncharacterized protein YbaR (Trm112 family)
MPLPPDLLSILITPDTHRPLRLVGPAELASLNARIASGQVGNRGGKPVTEPLLEGLRADGEPIVYPVVGGIPRLLSGDGIPMHAEGAPNPAVG